MKRLVLAGIVLALVCAAVGSASSPGAKASAVREAQRLLDDYAPPSGSVPLQAMPKGEHLPLQTPGHLFWTAVDRHRFWRVPASVSAIKASFEGQLRGWGDAAIVSTQGKHGLASAEATFTEPGFGGRATGRLLNLTAVKAHGGGSLLRADVVVVWQLSAAERAALPAGVREIDIWGPPYGYRLANVTKPAQVRTIARWFDHLPLYEPQYVALGCPLMRGRPTFTFDFKGRDGSVAKASVPVFSSVCSSARYTLRGHEQTSLIGGDFDYRVQELLGANWLGPPDVFGRAEIRRGTAEHTAAALIRAFTPPPGATKIHRPVGYGGVLISVPGPFGEFAQLTRYWHIDANVASVVSFLEAHDKPSGFQGDCGSNSHFGSAQCSLNAGRRRYLEFAVQRTRDGTSILRVDAQVVWVYPRSPKESVPAGRVREIDFSAPKVSKSVTGPDQIARIVRWFNRIPILPPGTGSSPSCIMQTVPVTLDFRGAGRKLLAHVSADVTEPQGGTSACNPMSVTIAGMPHPSLFSDNFFGRVQRAIGVTVS